MIASRQSMVLASFLMYEVGELSAHLDARGPAADDGEGQEVADAFLGHAGQAGRLEALHDAGAKVARVGDLFEEEAVLARPGGVEGVFGGADGDDEVVVGDCELLPVLNLRGAVDEFLVRVDVGRGGKEKFDLGVRSADGLCDGPILDCPDSRRGEHRSEDEETAR